MGLFRSMRELTSISHEIQQQQPPVAAQLAGAMASMQSATDAMAQLDGAMALEAELRAAGERAVGLVTGVRGGLGSVAGSSVLEVDVVVQAPGRPALPATLRSAVPPHLLHRVVTGAQLPLLTDPPTGRAVLDSVALATT